MNNEDVLSHWCALTTEVSEVDATVVLKMLVKLWITIWGFSFPSAWIELYKQQKEKPTMVKIFSKGHPLGS